MRVRKLLGLGLSVGLSVVGHAQTEPYNHHSQYLYGFFGKSVAWLGSEEVRVGGGIGYGYGKPEPHFRWGRIQAQLVFEGYYDQTSGRSSYRVGNENTYALGGLAYGRWFWPRNDKKWGMYGDLGWGLQYANQTSRDLNLRLNSTPVFGIGGIFPSGNREYLIGLRLLHISNAGLKEPNQGQNQLFLMLGVRF